VLNGVFDAEMCRCTSHFGYEVSCADSNLGTCSAERDGIIMMSCGPYIRMISLLKSWLCCRLQPTLKRSEQLRHLTPLDATIMCVDYLPEDLTRSRLRWYDLPALMLLHRPVRCRMCDQRYFTFGKKRVISPLATLWMHYAILISVVCLGVGIYKYQQNRSKTQEMHEVARTLSEATPHPPQRSRHDLPQNTRDFLPAN
jgi:hypothetical protein